jgi:hypothetical protein
MCRTGVIFCLVLVLGTIPVVQATDDPKAPIPTAWGKPVNGLQAGIRVNPSRHAGALELEVVVRNVGKEVVEFDHLSLVLAGEQSEGTMTAKCMELYGSYSPKGTRYRAKLAPGELHRLAGALIPRDEKAAGEFFNTPKVRPGENRIGAEGVVVRLAGAKEVELATGYLDVQITPSKK